MRKAWTVIVGALLFAACGKEVSPDSTGRYISFQIAGEVFPVETRSSEVSVSQSNTSMPVRGDEMFAEPLFLYTEESEGIDHEVFPATRGTQVTALSSAFTFGVSEFTAGGTAVPSFQNVRPYYESGSGIQRYNSGHSWEADAITGTSYAFYAYSPRATSAGAQGITLASGNKTLTYNITGLTATQHPDLMTAFGVSSYAESVPLAFSHRLCAVRLVLGSDWTEGFTVTDVQFGNIVPSGMLAIDTGDWNSLGVRTSYSVPDALSSCLMMIPQSVSSSTLSITLEDRQGKSHVLTVTLTGSWTAGKTVTYTLRPKGITSMTVSYPKWDDGSSGTYGPISSYDVDTKFGLYVMKTDGTAVHSNLQVGVRTFSGSTATLDLPDAFYSKTYRYFLYYPYQASPGSVTANATDAVSFFSGLISGWSVSGTQNTLTAFKAQDLQVGMLSGTSFTMQHRMGLAKATYADKTVPKEITYTYNTDTPVSTVTNSTNTTVSPARSFNSATALRLLNVSTATDMSYWSIVQATSTTDNARVELASNPYVPTRDWWTLSLTGIGYGKYKAFSITSNRPCYTYVALFPYTGSIRTFRAPWRAACHLEVWGAQGYTGSNNAGTTYIGGYGGYAEGVVALSKDETVYVFVGQQGQSVSGWPNGGEGMGNNDTNSGAGGGSTHIAFSNTMPYEYNDRTAFMEDVLIMAGGGGGEGLAKTGGWYGHGGAGGGVRGYPGTNYSTGLQGGAGGTQTEGGIGGTPNHPELLRGKLGKGGTGEACSGGGGGFYGGGGSWGAGAGGGSGFIGNERLYTGSNITKRMVGYFDKDKGYTSATTAITDDNADTKTESTTNVSGTPTTGYAKTGHGYARITLL